MSVLEVDTAKRKFTSTNMQVRVEERENPYAEFLEFSRILDKEQEENPCDLPELSEREIVAICKQARHELRAKHPEIYAPN
jgi:hypothetical protein